jgi:hypothetical protein
LKPAVGCFPEITLILSTEWVDVWIASGTARSKAILKEAKPPSGDFGHICDERYTLRNNGTAWTSLTLGVRVYLKSQRIAHSCAKSPFPSNSGGASLAHTQWGNPKGVLLSGLFNRLHQSRLIGFDSN